MRQVYNIARAELQSFFYSPIAWLILIIFTLQCSLAYCDTLALVAKEMALGTRLPSLTDWFFTAFQGNWGVSVFYAAMKYLYIFYPLLTMGLISRELANGSIRLLDSSPVRPSQVVWGKFMSMAVYSLLLIAVLMLFVVPNSITTENFNWSLIWVGLLGILLTMLAYSAIGIFLSSLTHYPVVAAIGSFAVFMALDRAGQYGQQWDGVRDITTWLSMSGRSNIFMKGLLTSQNVVYFVGIIAMFIAFTILKLRLAHYHYSKFSQAVRYAAVAVAVVGVGWLTSRPALRMYADVTQTQSNTLDDQSRAVMEQLRDKGPLTITSYVNLMDRHRMFGMPRSVSQDKAAYERYTRFKPDIKFRYVYYYAPSGQPMGIERIKPHLTFEETAREIARSERVPFRIFKTKEEIDAIVDLEPEHYQFVRFFELADGRRSVLRMFDETPPMPDEREIAVAFKRLATDVPQVGFVAGHGERSIHDGSGKGYERIVSSIFNRFSLLSQGLDGVEVRLTDGGIPESMEILVIADPQTAYTPDELAALDAYLVRGGNLVLLVEPDSHAITAPLLERFGVKLAPGQLAQTPVIELANVVGANFTQEAIDAWNLRGAMFGIPMTAMPGAGALEPAGTSAGYTALPLMITHPDSWNKIGQVDWIQGDISPVESRGERTGPFAAAVMLTRMVGEREQRIMITGDADWFDNREVQSGRQGFNSYPSQVAYYLFRWMTYGTAPIYIRHAAHADTTMRITQAAAVRYEWVYEWILPGLLLICGAAVLIRRNRK